MGMKKTGTPVEVVPSLKVQGYLDAIKNLDAKSQDEVYLSGYNLGKSVQRGEKEKPTWA